MKVGIIGGGAVGLLVASYMRKANLPVTLFSRRETQRQKILEEGLRLDAGENSFFHDIEVAPIDLQQLESVDILFIAVKQYGLEEVVGNLRKMKRHPALVFLQNGMGHIEYFDALVGFPSIFISIVEHGAYKDSDNIVIHTGLGQIKIGAFKGFLEDWRELWKKLNNVGFPFILTEDWLEMMKQKLLVNACINPLTAIYKVENGCLIENAYFQSLMYELYAEACSALQLTKEKSRWDNIELVCKQTAKNRSSMLRDLEEGRQTEIEAISGYVLREGGKRDVNLPYTSFVYASIKGLEERREKSE